MHSHLVALTALLATTATTPLSAQTAAEPLAPSGPWAIDYGERGCELKRDFGTGSQLVTITFAQALAPLETGITLRGAGSIAIRDADRVSIVAPTDGVSESSLSFGALRSPLPEDPPFAGMFRSLASFAAVEGAVVLTVADGRRSVASLVLHRISEGLAALRTCQDDLYRMSGIDAAMMRRVAIDAEPFGNEAFWATSDDLPPQFRSLAQPKVVTMRLHIGTVGRATQCWIMISSGESVLDQQACRVMVRRARFTPARDTEGNVVPTIKIRRIRWQAPQ